MIRVLVVDDSPFICRLLAGHLQSSPEIEVVGTALNGRRAVDLICELRPDVVTLDQEMPEMSGLDSLAQIMTECPTPVVMISGVSRRAAGVTREALQMGAVDFVLKYTPGQDVSPDSLRLEIVSKVKAAAGIKVIRSISNRPMARSRTHLAKASVLPLSNGSVKRGTPTHFVQAGVVVIGASTGGPVAVRKLLERLPSKFAPAVLVVQHIPATFTDVLAAQLARHTTLPVKEAAHGEIIRGGHVYVAPGDSHLLVGADSRIQLNNGPKIRGHRPAIDVTMQSVAQVYGSKTTGVVLTGMGDDGSEGLVAIRTKGGRTFAQDGDSSVVNGMPLRARERGVVDRVGSPREIAGWLR